MTASMDEEAKSGWCREKGLYPNGLETWRQGATAVLAEPEEARVSPQQNGQAKKRIKELERELKRKDKALAETAALLVRSKKLSAIYGEGTDERSVWKIAKSWLRLLSKPRRRVHG